MTKKKPSNKTPTTQLGLAAALGDGSVPKPEVQLVAISDLDGTIQKPTRYDAQSWNDFVASIQRGGLEQPIIVRPATTKGRYMIVEGRHRALAHANLKLASVPAIVRTDYDDAGAAMAEFTTNYQRAAPTAAEQAHAFAKARDAGMTVDDIAKRAGISSSTVRGRLDLLHLGAAAAMAGGDNLSLPQAEALGRELGKLPAEMREAAIKGLLAAEKKGGYWSPRAVVRDAIVKAGLAHDPSEHHERIDYYKDTKPWDRAVAKMPSIQVGGHTLVTDRQALDDAAAKLAAKRQADKKQADEVKDAGLEDRAHRLEPKIEARIRMHHAALRINGMISLTPDQEFRAWVRLVERPAPKKDIAQWLTDLGLPEDFQEAASAGWDKSDADLAVLRTYYDDPAKRLRAIATAMCLDEAILPTFSADEDRVKEWTGRTAKEIGKEAEREARAQVMGKKRKEPTASESVKVAKKDRTDFGNPPSPAEQAAAVLDKPMRGLKALKQAAEENGVPLSTVRDE